MIPKRSFFLSLSRRNFLSQSVAGLSMAYGVPWMTAEEDAQRTEQQALYWAWWGWEPIDHYRLSKGIVGAVDTQSPALEQWYERFHSFEVVDMMADLGFNLGFTHFFKGLGLVYEAKEQERTAALVKRAHARGIKMLGYCQSRSLYYAQFLPEAPDAEEWIQRDENGKLRTWGGSKHRWAPCIHSKRFRTYMKRAIRVGLEEIALDGFHFDNNYCQPCYCERCEKAFRAHLAKQGWESPVEEIRQPVLEKLPDVVTDPLAREWVRWRCEALAEYQAELSSYARQLRSDILLIGNPAYPRGPNSPCERSVWAPMIGKHLDLLFAENSSFPGYEDGVLTSQVRAFKHAHAVGYRVVSTVWKKDKLTGLGLPTNEAEIALQVAESAANDAIPGSNWALRSDGQTDRMRVERPVLKAAIGKHLHFAHQTESLRIGAEPLRDIAVLHTLESTAFDNRESFPLIQGVEEILIRGGFLWDVVFGDDLSQLGEFNVLLIAGQSMLSQEHVKAIQAFHDSGKAIIIAGESPALRQLQVPRISSEEIRAVAVEEGGQVSLQSDWQNIATIVEETSRDRSPLRLRGSDTMTLSAYQLGDSRLVAHVVNYSPTAVSGLTLELGASWKNLKNARLLAPGEEDRELSILQKGDHRIVEIPSIHVYGIVVAS